MKLAVAKLKTVALIILVMGSMTGFAQGKMMMYVMKNGEAVFSTPVSGVDNVTFDKASSDSALIIQKNDGSLTGGVLLNDIQQLSFSDDGLSVETSTGSETYAFDDIAKFVFGNGSITGITNPPAQNGFDVLVYLAPSGDATVKSSSPIQSLTLFSVDGKMISRQQYNGMETQCIVPLQGRSAGIYLLRVETRQNAIVKKIVKS